MTMQENDSFEKFVPHAKEAYRFLSILNEFSLISK